MRLFRPKKASSAAPGAPTAFSGAPSSSPQQNWATTTPPGGVMGAAGQAGAPATSGGVEALLESTPAGAAPSAERVPVRQRLAKLGSAVDAARKRGGQLN